MSVKTRTNRRLTHEMSPTTPRNVSSRAEAKGSRRRRVLKTGELFHFDLDSPTEERIKVSRTKSFDEDTPQKKCVKTPFRSAKKVKTSVATDSSRNRRKSSVLTRASSRDENVEDTKKSKKAERTSFNTFYVDIEPSLDKGKDVRSPLAEENLQKGIKSPLKSAKKTTTEFLKKNSSVIHESLSKMVRSSCHDNTRKSRFSHSGVRLFKTIPSDTDSVVEEKNLLLDASSSQAKSPSVKALKRKSSECMSRSMKKVKSATTPNLIIDSPTKRHQPLVLKKASPLFLKSPHSNVDNSQIVEEKNFVLVQEPLQSLPVEETRPKRKIVKAKRLLNHTSNQSKINESAVINTDSEVLTSLKKKRRTWQRQDNFDVDSFCEFINAENKNKPEIIEVGEENGGEEIIDLVTDETEEEAKIEERQKINSTFELVVTTIEDAADETEEQTKIEQKQKENSTFELVVTTIEEPISPSTTNPDPQLSDKSLSPIQNLLHFETSKEEIHPSTNGLAPETTSRRTYELTNSVNDVSVLKTVSEQDSLRISGNKSLPFSDAIASHSKVTVRRKVNKNDSFIFDGQDSRISEIRPPWMTENDFDVEDKSSPETSTPMPVEKGRFTLLKEILLKDKPTAHNQNFTGLGPINIQNSTIKKETPHNSFKNVSMKKHGSSVKVPNFAAIHQRALDKIENISEYQKRKEERAKMLLSGRKPPVLQTPKNKSKKTLRFDPGTSDNPKPVDFIPLPSTPLPKRTYNESMDSTITPVQHQMPDFNFVKIKDNQFPSTRSILTPKYKGKICKSNSIQVLSPKNNVKEAFRFGVNNNRFGFNAVKPAQILKKVEIKAMVTTKSKLVKNVADSRRVMIKGVRSNRRFELLMNMRKGK